METQPITKYCHKCGETKEITQFHKDIQGKLGVRGECKTCRSERQTKERVREEQKTILESRVAKLEEENKRLNEIIITLGERDVELGNRFHKLSMKVDRIREIPPPYQPDKAICG